LKTPSQKALEVEDVCNWSSCLSFENTISKALEVEDDLNFMIYN